MKRLPVAPIAVALGMAVHGRASDGPSLTDILDRAAQYVQQYEQDLSVVMSDEVYHQDESFDSRVNAPLGAPTRGPFRDQRHLDLRSEMLFLWVPQEQSWISVRNVVRVGLKSISDSKDRLERALEDPTPGKMTRLHRLAAEGARFNLGFYRDYNSPTLALQFLDPEFQPRFTFTLAGQERLDGVTAWKIAFAEHQRPTVIVSDGQNTFATGALWMRVPDGIVVRTNLTLKVPETRKKPGMTGSVVVDYRLDRKLSMWVPSRMKEKYVLIGGDNDLIDCDATYSHFRRFETSGRLLPSR